VKNFLSGFKDEKIPLVEIFQSISGEGVSVGNVVTFVRVAGCDLRCTWCDTKYSFKTSGEGIEQLLPDQIIERLNNLGPKEIICTGGEPLEHNKSKRYLPAYLQSKGFNVRIETSGGSNVYSEEELTGFDLNSTTRPVYTMDIKCPASRMDSKNIFDNIELLDKRDELKFVAADEQDLSYSMDVIEKHKEHLANNQITLNFSPVFESLKPVDLVGFMIKNNEYFQSQSLKARMSLQIHKFIWPPHQRGV